MIETMKKISILFMLLIAVVTARAAANVVIEDGTLVITLNASGDLASYRFTAEQKNATSIKVVSANGSKMSTADVAALLGGSWATSVPFPKITNLDLGLADLATEGDIARLGENSNRFNNGGMLGTVILPESLTSTPFVFNDNNDRKVKWTTVIFPDATKTDNQNTTVINANTFSHNTYLRKLVIGTSVQSIGRNAFDGCNNLTEVDYLEGVQHISSHAFYGCSGLTKVILPETLTEIGDGAFEQCTSLSTVRLPNSLKYIRTQAFDHTALCAIIIPASVELIENGAFGHIPTLTDVYVMGANTKAASQAFLPTEYTYQYHLSSPHADGSTVSLSDYYSSRPGVYTVLHYPAEAYERYVNKFIQVIGTPEYANHPEYASGNNHWVFLADGTKLPITGADYFDRSTGDYAGWNEFMLVGRIKNTYIDERLVDSKWYSVCFPFGLSAKQIGNAFGSATEVCEFSGAHILQDEAGKNYLRLEFKNPVTEMKAHHPYMIHPGLRGAKQNVIVDVVIDNDESGYAAKLQDEAVSQFDERNHKYTFIGNHTEGAKVPKYSYYYYSGNDTQWANGFYKAMRTDVVFTPHTAVVTQGSDNGISSGAKTLYFAEDFMGETTGIEATLMEQAPAKTAASQHVYNSYGQLVRTGSTSLSGLPAGLYIVNGKKYVVK